MPVTNTFRPTALSFNSYGWKGSPLYNRADVPTRWVEGATAQDRVVIEQQLAYEWLNSAEGGGAGSGGIISTNPPFLGGSAGKLLPGLTTESGIAPRILRGFIRRAEADWSDPAAMARLYFMYNPETITRDYVSYLDQGALDPFNTVYQSGNLVAPPSYMDFTFSLFFDRQEEAAAADHPGVFVDYQYFDLVVRNVIPATDPNSMNNTLPDNGIMMVNPRDITVIFSPQITVQGRPSNARVSFTRFTHRMVPTRMQIDLTMRVVYFGPMKDMTTYVKDEETAQAQIPWNASLDNTFSITAQDIANFKQEFTTWFRTGSGDNDISSDAAAENGSAQIDNATRGSDSINVAACDYAAAQVANNNTQYASNSGKRMNHWSWADCSSLVWGGYVLLDEANAAKMGYPGKGGWAPTAQGHWDLFKTGKTPGTMLWEIDGSKSQSERENHVRPKLQYLRKGDLIFRIKVPSISSSNHIAFFDHWEGEPGNSTPWITHAGSPTSMGRVQTSVTSLAQRYNKAFRPLPSGGRQLVTVNPYISSGGMRFG